MIEIKSPSLQFLDSTGNVRYPNTKYLSCFLAGGITNCHDWQSDVVRLLSDTNITFLNPRREDFDVNNKTHSELQIVWEHAHLGSVEVIAFWFPWETLCPISLFELGAHINKKIIVGVDPEYQRKFDVIQQMKLARPDLTVMTSFDDFVAEIRQTIC